MESLDLFPNFKITNIKSEKEDLKINLQSNRHSANCPYCFQKSDRKNGHYTRYPYVLPLGEKRVRLEIRIQRYLCLNKTCSYRTFAEQLALVNRNAQRCQRLHNAHANIALTLGGEAGSALATKLNLPISADTLLRDIKLQPLPPIETPRVLGVDDWALKKRDYYGTILVDLEKHKVIDERWTLLLGQQLGKFRKAKNKVWV